MLENIYNFYYTNGVGFFDSTQAIDFFQCILYRPLINESISNNITNNNDNQITISKDNYNSVTGIIYQISNYNILSIKYSINNEFNSVILKCISRTLEIVSRRN